MKMRLEVILLFFFFIPVLCFSQKKEVVYFGLSSDSLISNHQIIFQKDSVLELSTFPRHMSQQFKAQLNYRRVNESVFINTSNLNSIDSIKFINNNLQQFLQGVILKIDNRAILDENNSVIYVLYDDFGKNYFITYLIEGEEFKQKSSLPDSYGLLKTTPKTNKRLKKKLNSINAELEDYEINVHKGIDAYRRFGYESVFGVIELNKKK
jgi:hypothetical protein